MNKSVPVLYVAITSHGFGHAVRAASVAAMVKNINPEIIVILATTVPRWLLDGYITGDFIQRHRACDVGVIQSDSFKMDYGQTLTKIKEIRQHQDQIIAGEVNFLKTNNVGLILGDIPPLAAPMAKKAGIPCWMMSNFGWDFIYRDWGGEFLEIADWIGDCYHQCDRLFRLPMHESMGAFEQITDVGLTGGIPKYSEADLRQKFNLIQPKEQIILLTFGGLGLDAIPYHNLSHFSDWQFITFDRQAPDLPNLVKITDHHYRPVDLMPICGRVISKPGYSTFAEALRLDIPLVSLTREGFAEAELLLNGIRNYGHHQIIESKQFFDGNWDFLREMPKSPQQDTVLDKNGTEVIARAIVDYFA